MEGEKEMKKEYMIEQLDDAAKKYSEQKKVAKRPETQFKAGAMWLWGLLFEAHEAIYYEEVLRRELIDRIGEVEAWKESLITDTAMMMADRDGMMADIMEEGRLIDKRDKNGFPYKESNPLYVHKKELDRSIGMQREHLGLSNKVNPKRITENAKRGVDSEKDGLMSRIDEVQGAMNDVQEM